MRMRNWFTPALFMALLAISGTVYAHDGDGRCDKSGWQMHEDGGALPDAKRQLLHDTMKKVFEKDKTLISQMHDLHKKRHEILAADKFDRQAFVTATAQIEKVRDRLHADRARAFASIAGQFTPEEREMIARMHRHNHHGHDDHDGAWRHHGEWGDHSMGEGSSPPQEENAYPPYPSK
jgi:Spy/CpxP family protein refolding chaperone